MDITPGRTVLYQLSEADVDRIVAARMGDNGARGNQAREGDIVPLIVVRVWPDGVNGQAILDGNHTLWVTSVPEGDRPGAWSWPPRV